MDLNAYRDDTDAGQPDAYWRRRVITLCAGLALLGLLIWALSGSGKPASPPRKGAQANGVLPAVAYSSSAASPSPGAYASPSAVPAGSLPFPSLTASARSGRSGPGRSANGKSATRSASPGAGRAGATPAGGVEPSGACAPGAVVLSLFTTKASYPAGQFPVFEVYAVSTASRTCTLDISPAKLHVQVMSSGRVIWDSADCARGLPNRVAELRRGVPAQGSVTWNRTVSLPGCVTLASAARPGTYQVQARDVTVASLVRTFKLAR